METLLLYTLFFRLLIHQQIQATSPEMWQSTQSPFSNLHRFSVWSKYHGRTFFTAGKILLQKQVILPGPLKANLDDCLSQPVCALDSEVEAFYHRWLYLKLFSKAYFGPAMAGFSVLAGFQCLQASFLVSILWAKAYALAGDKVISLSNIYEAYWRLERVFIGISQMPESKSELYDTILSTPRLFKRLLFKVQSSFTPVRETD